MIITIDVGNTETTLGLFRNGELASHWRLTTAESRTPDELGLLLRSLLDRALIPVDEVRGGAIGSVVPTMNSALLGACKQWLGVSPLVIDARSPLPITLAVEEPLTVGADRLINTLAASRLYGRDTIVVDLGTATTFDCITREGVFLGGVIAPGVLISAQTLFRRTSKLPALELETPERVIGRRTEECIRSGVLYGAADSIDGIVRRIKAEWPQGREVPLVVATGGLADLMAEHCSELEEVEPYLTLRGLKMAYDLLSANPTG